MYRRRYFLQRKKIVMLIKVNKRLRRQLRANEDFLFGPLLDGFL